jgi:phage regulator Rha-like protein
MDTNLILTLIGLAITVIGGVMVFIINQSSKISELKGRLDTLESKKGLHEQVAEIHRDSIHKLQQRATELHDTTQTQLNHLATDIAQQQTQVHASLQVLKTQEASSLAVLKERAQQLVQQFQEIEQGVQQLRSTTEAESARLMAEIVQQRAQVKQEIEQMSTRLASLEVQVDKLKNTGRFWWYQLDEQWQAIFKGVIGGIFRTTEGELTEDELVEILSLTKLECCDNNLTSLEPLRALTGLQNLDCRGNQLTNLESLRALTGLQMLYCGGNPLTSLEPLRALSGLQTLFCENNQLTSLEPLRALTGLQNLDCRGNQLTSLEPLRALTGLQTLICYANQLTSLEPLHGLKNLKQLWCGGNPSLSVQEIERFKKAVPACEVHS